MINISIPVWQFVIIVIVILGIIVLVWIKRNSGEEEGLDPISGLLAFSVILIVGAIVAGILLGKFVL